MACFHICAPVISIQNLEQGHALLMQFCSSFENTYGKNRVTPNMHLHRHLKDCVLDYGPVYSFWLFSFERFKGILGSFCTNNRSVELQIMRKFLYKQQIIQIPLPQQYRDILSPVMKKMEDCQSGTLGERIPLSLSLFCLSDGVLQRCLEWANVETYNCFPPCLIDTVDEYHIPHLRQVYEDILPAGTVLEGLA